MIMKEISADQVLTLLFISLGSEAKIDFKDIDRFFEVLKEVRDNIIKNSEYNFGINMPMNGNYNCTLFNEIKSRKNIGKIELVKEKLFNNRERTKEKFSNYFISLTGNNKQFF